MLLESYLLPPPELVLSVARTLMMTSWVLAFISGIGILLARAWSNRQKRKEAAIKEQVADLIMEFLLTAEEATPMEARQLLSEFGNKIREQFMGTALARRVVRENLMDTARHVRGNVVEALRQLYSALLLDTLALQNLQYGEWHEQTEAIHELTTMHVTAALPYIEQLRQHPNQQVRLQTQLAEMRLNEKHPLSFLDEVKTPLHPWQQVALHAELMRLPKEKVPSFRSWLHSSNPGVVVFAIKMIVQFNQLNLLPYVIMKSLDPNQEVRHEVWRLMSYFHIPAAATLIEHLLPESEPEMQLNMINCLAELQTMEAEELLIKIIDQDAYGLRTEAAIALQRSGYDVVGQWPALTSGLNAQELVAQRLGYENFEQVLNS